MRKSPVVRSALVVYATLKRKMAEEFLREVLLCVAPQQTVAFWATHPLLVASVLQSLSDGQVQNTLNCPDGVKPSFPNILFAALTCKLKANWTFVPKQAKLAHLPGQ